MTGRRSGRAAAGPSTPREIARTQLRKRAWTGTVGAVVLWGLEALVVFGWWHAQVTGKQGSGGRSYVEGSPFPWVTVLFVGVLACLSVVKAVGWWSDYRRSAAASRRPQDTAGPGS